MLKKFINSNLIILFLYFVAITVIFRDFLMSSGIIMGGDWSLPATSLQIDSYLRTCSFAWSESLFGNRGLCLSSLIVIVPEKIFQMMGIGAEVFPKIMIIFLFETAGFFSYLLLRKLGTQKAIAFFGGLIYFTTPIFFDYLLMGWFFIILFLSSLPLVILFFVKAIEHKNPVWLFLNAFVFLFVVQPQAILWVPIIWICFILYLVKTKEDLKRFIIYSSAGILLYFFINAYWFLGLFFIPDPKIVGSDIVKSAVSIGTSGYFTPINFVRLFGASYNFQFETIIRKSPLVVFSFLLPFLSFLSLVFNKNKKLSLSLGILAILPFFLYFLNINREWMLIIPFSNVFRDISRFTVIHTFAYSVLAALFVNYVSQNTNRKKAFIFTAILFVLWFISVFPWWRGDLTAWQEGIGPDIRIRTKVFPKEYDQAENLLSKEKADAKVLYLPAGGTVSFKDNQKFNGSYKEIRDVYSLFPPLPGSFSVSDKNSKEPVVSLTRFLFTDIDERLYSFLKIANVKYIVWRKDLVGGNEPKIQETLEKAIENGILVEEYNNQVISYYRVVDFLPHFYISTRSLYSNIGVEDLKNLDKTENLEKGYSLFNNNKDLVFTPDKIILKSDLLDKIENGETLTGKGFDAPILSFSNQKPGTLSHFAVLLIEKYERWKTRNDPAKSLETELFFSGKRIAELIKFDDATKNSLGETVKDSYYHEMLDALSIIDNLRSQNDPKYLELLEKFNSTIILHQKTLKESTGSLGKIEDILLDLGNKAKGMLPAHDFSQETYSVNIPQNGEYEMLTYEDNASLSVGKKYFQKGLHPLIIPAMRISKSLINKKLEISSYLPGSIYQVSFEYKTLKPFIFTLKENNSDKDLFRKPLPSTDDNNYQRFEAFFKSSMEGTSAAIHFISDNNEKTDLKYQNLQVKRIYEPSLVLKSTQKINNINGLTDSKINGLTNNKLTDSEINGLKNSGLTNYEKITPKITFVKINPTKYRVKVEGAIDPYTLVFSESFHEGWKLYINGLKNDELTDYGETVASYFNGEIKEGTHRNIFLENVTFETWGKKPIPEERHLFTNGYANSWYITPEDSEGKQNYEIILEFVPQRLFYIGLFVSFLTLVLCLGYLFISVAKKLWKRNS